MKKRKGTRTQRIIYPHAENRKTFAEIILKERAGEYMKEILFGEAVWKQKTNSYQWILYLHAKSRNTFAEIMLKKEERDEKYKKRGMKMYEGNAICKNGMKKSKRNSRQRIFHLHAECRKTFAEIIRKEEERNEKYMKEISFGEILWKKEGNNHHSNILSPRQKQKKKKSNLNQIYS